ncbi:MAG: hypothetical protein ACE369_03780 [Roseovarius sp.]
MTYPRITHDTRLEQREAKTRVARKWARRVGMGLTALCLTAVWQERALAPAVHDRMQAAYVYGMDWLKSTETGGGYLTAMGDFSGLGNQPEHNAITRALLKLRQ